MAGDRALRGDPVHYDDRFGRLVAVSAWVVGTDRQRPLVIHSGNLDCASPAHVTVPTAGVCWCRPETIPAGGNA